MSLKTGLTGQAAKYVLDDNYFSYYLLALNMKYGLIKSRRGISKTGFRKTLVTIATSNCANGYPVSSSIEIKLACAYNNHLLTSYNGKSRNW